MLANDWSGAALMADSHTLELPRRRGGCLMKLKGRTIEKPWGVEGLPPPFCTYGGGRIGEVIFSEPDDQASRLLLKFIFTSEKLSVQVHPNDMLARSKGLPHGKTECWYILEAEAEAVVALGFRHPVDGDTAQAAALDGTVESLLNWLPVSTGDFLYVPAGTVHAIGAGIKLLEIQQNIDVTYRLFDYGRPRDLHLADAMAAASLNPYDTSLARSTTTETTQLLVSSEFFSVLRMTGAASGAERLENRRRWVVPLRGSVFTPDQAAGAGECICLAPSEPLESSPNGMFIVAVEGPLQ
jgi:mannose-6-phosphate isomerase